MPAADINAPKIAPLVPPSRIAKLPMYAANENTGPGSDCANA